MNEPKTNKIEWKTPPPSLKGRGKVGDILNFVEELKKRPMEWAIYSASQRGAQTTRLTLMYPGSEWTARTNKPPDGTFTIYGRWVGVPKKKGSK